MGRPMTYSRTVEYPVKLANGDHAYIWAENGYTANQIRDIGKAMGLDVVQVSKAIGCNGRN